MKSALVRLALTREIPRRSVPVRLALSRSSAAGPSWAGFRSRRTPAALWTSGVAVVSVPSLCYGDCVWMNLASAWVIVGWSAGSLRRRSPSPWTAVILLLRLGEPSSVISGPGLLVDGVLTA